MTSETNKRAHLRRILLLWELVFEKLIPIDWNGPSLAAAKENLRRLADEILRLKQVPMGGGSVRSSSAGQLAGALALAQGAMSNPEKKIEVEVHGKRKDGSPTSYTYHYADLAGVVESIRPHLAANGLAYLQALSFDGERACCVTELIHSSGEWVRTTLPWHCPTDDIQKVGSLFTYLRRYALGALVGVAPEADDDGRRGKVKRPSNPITQGQREREGGGDKDPNRVATPADISAFYKNFWPITTSKFGSREAAEKWLKDQDPNLNQCTYARLRQLLEMVRARRPETEDQAQRQSAHTQWAITCEKKGLDEATRHWWAQTNFGWVFDAEKGRASAKGTPLNQVKDAIFALQRMKAPDLDKIKQDYLLWLDDQRAAS